MQQNKTILFVKYVNYHLVPTLAVGVAQKADIFFKGTV
jgi:hypothetical protein